ncbi:MAG: UDP-N-acetylmuramoyl-L-alanyl-D-glutamate--2,6-diaminopimelate ligase [Janthinobacterium lividum]
MPLPATLAEMMRTLDLPAPAGLPDTVTGLTADSRQVRPGMLYAALPGSRVDGRAFIADAVRRGAAVVLAPLGTDWPEGVPARPLILDAEPRRALARLAALRAGPQPEAVAAITGTNGKTSTADFLRQILALDGVRAASIGTLGVVGPDGAGAPGLTTPDPVALAETLAALARDGVRAAALEASSHGLEQFRLDGVALRAAGFTNLTRDHLDYHGSMAAYRAAKLRLFSALLPAGAVAVASTALDGETLAALRAIAAARGLVLRLVGEGGDAIRLLEVTPQAGGQMLTLEADGVRRTVALRVPGRFQVDNALLAAGLAAAMGVADPLRHLPALVGVRGRMELAAEPRRAAAYVDYAHTPDALERLLLGLRPHTAGRLVLVFGAGGDRDTGKRPLMGAVAARLADVAIVTDDNPRGEDPAAIRAAILAACPDAREIGDRAAAIKAGLGMLRPGDVLVVAGKGHESGQTAAGVTTPFDDAAVIRGLAATA